MPGSILNADINFPHFTGNETTETKIDAIQNYLYMLYEQLRYSMGNLGTENFSEGGIKDLEKIVAKNIDLTGFVTFKSLSESGQTVINGANISTGTISADRLSLTGAITFGDLNSSLQNTINSKASGTDVYTIITSTLVSSPNIAGASFWDINRVAKLQMHAGPERADMTITNTSVEIEMMKLESWSVGDSSDVSIYLQEVLFANTNSREDSISLFNIGLMKLDSAMYGSSLPPSGSEGMLFFKI